jgi:ubiquinone/menaquinone biosynthesis C-methylase UbiE
MPLPSWLTRRRLLVSALVVVALGAGAAWLGLQAFERAESERIASLLDLSPGMTVADVGAGDGEYAVAVAKRVGPAGRVYATEITENLRDDIRRAAERAGLANIVVVEAGEERTGLHEDCCDAIYLRHVYHHLATAAPIVADLKAALKPGGTLAIIDFEPRGGDHGIPRDKVVDELRAGGFEVEPPRDWSGRDFVVVARQR